MKDLLIDAYLSQRGVAKFFDCSKEKAKRLYQTADEIDSRELEFRLHPDRIRKSTACRLLQITVEEANKKYAETLGK